jgi:hypothetical protein
MAPPLTKEQLEVLNKVFYKDQMMMGRDKLYDFLRSEYADKRITRRQVAEWLCHQEINQKFVISKLIKPVIKDNTEYYEVQWKGYCGTTLELRDELLEDVPKMVKQYEKKNKIAFYDSKNKKTNKITRRIYNGKNSDE